MVTLFPLDRQAQAGLRGLQRDPGGRLVGDRSLREEHRSGVCRRSGQRHPELLIPFAFPQVPGLAPTPPHPFPQLQGEQAPPNLVKQSLSEMPRQGGPGWSRRWLQPWGQSGVLQSKTTTTSRLGPRWTPSLDLGLQQRAPPLRPGLSLPCLPALAVSATSKVFFRL